MNRAPIARSSSSRDHHSLESSMQNTSIRSFGAPVGAVRREITE